MRHSDKEYADRVGLVGGSAAALPALQQDSRAAAPTAAAIGDTSWRRTVFTSALAVVRASHAGLAEASRAPGHGLSLQ